MKKEPVGSQEGFAVAEKIKAVAYIECSAKNSENVRDVFEAVSKIAIADKIKKKNPGFCKMM